MMSISSLVLEFCTISVKGPQPGFREERGRSFGWWLLSGNFCLFCAFTGVSSPRFVADGPIALGETCLVAADISDSWWY
jgi:hypothetical protein